MFRITAAFSLLALATPASSQTMIDQLIGRVTKRNTSSPGAPDPARNLATMTPGQSAAIDRLLATPMQPASVASERASAGPLIRIVLSVAACARNGTAFNVLNRDSLTPKTYDAGGGGYANEAPMRNMKYHDGNGCLDVTRLSDWSRPALNALRFKVFYVAGDSGEAANQTFELQKDADGRWLVRHVDLAML